VAFFGQARWGRDLPASSDNNRLGPGLSGVSALTLSPALAANLTSGGQGAGSRQPNGTASPVRPPTSAAVQQPGSVRPPSATARG